jgi:aminoglycoside/choline kinase family phosphotransferase
LGSSVVGVAVEPLEIAGAAGELGRVLLSYDTDGAAGPRSVIAKFRGTSETQQAMDAALGIFARERRFYVEAAPLLPVATPACFHAGDGDQLPLLLEDLRDLRMGDQVAGLSLPDAERLIDVLADLHATFWEKPIPGDAEWTVSLCDPMFAGMLTQLITSGLPALKERYSGRVPDHVLAALADAAPNWAEVLARCDEGPRTLVHNDCRLDNLFFRPDGTPVFIDWQLTGHTRGTQDVAYLISGSLQPDVLHGAWEGLLRRYHERLCGNGVAGYSWDECRTHYRQSLLYTLAPGVAMLGAMAIAGDDRGLADALVLRTLTHAAELDAFSTL